MKEQVNPQMIEEAAARLQGVIHRTPVSSSRTFSEMTGMEVYLKCENLQKTGSFKVRGAYNKIAAMADRKALAPLAAASAGNHAQGVAFAAKTMGCSATIVMPKATPLAKISATKAYGARVLLYGDCYDEACAHALTLAQEHEAVFVHPFDDPEVIAGQGTISLEILRELPNADAVVVPVGGGGLLAGMALSIKQINPRIRVVGVQAEGADAAVRSFQTAEALQTDRCATIADGIAVNGPGRLTMELIRRYADEMVTVTDDQIADAVLLMMERMKQVIEPAGAASLAAVLSQRIRMPGKKVVCMLSGGNIDMGFIHRLVERGLISRGRQLKFRMVMGDVPGNLQKVSGIIAQGGGNITLVQHDRLSSDLRLGDAILHVACEVSGSRHGQEILLALEQAGYPAILEN